MNIEITRNDLDHIIPSLQQSFQRAHDLTALDLWGNLRENSPQEHGRLAGSWKLEKRGPLLSIVGTNVKYALVQNDGRGPFNIYPRTAKALRFKINGNTIFAKRVRHPGIKGKKYIEKSVEETRRRIPEFIEIALSEQGLT